ncbi:AI-2E family transporter [Paenibacillus pasadenensis]|uniref:AI-2E family transporter n=1 Tax=Paenibacillus pasadenensis TaxID=217090 RepID=UPI00203AAD08|nr:AI-2E family transporter [Paenibacillus pasadenensis]MCM3746633.1 AI-2E family transporter [Paenibacillus pasadenensis]
MLMFYRKYWRTAFDIGLIVLTVYLIMLAFTYLYSIAAPIFLSFLIFAVIEPLAKLLNRVGIKKSIASAISIMIFSALILGVFFGAGYIMVREATTLADKLPEYQIILQEQVDEGSSWLKEQIGALPPGTVDKLQEYIDSLTRWGQKVAEGFLLKAAGYLSSVSTFMFNFVIGIILAYFLSIEIGSWKRIATNKTPKTFKKAFFFLRENVFSGILAYLKAQLKLISITFAVVFVSLLVLGVENALTISVIAAVFDVLPLLGVGTVFVPWILYLVAVGDFQLAIWLGILFLVIVAARQILEPLITGDTLGVSAFTMLAFMVLSLSLFGIAGVILSPILLILVKALYDQGYFRRWITPPQGEYDVELAEKG